MESYICEIGVNSLVPMQLFLPRTWMAEHETKVQGRLGVEDYQGVIMDY